MAMADNDFWRRGTAALPGMFDLGAGVYGMTAGQREAQRNLQMARGPLYDQALTGSAEALTAAGKIDPAAAGQTRLNQQMGLLAGKDQADEAALMRSLYAKGMLGAGTVNPGVEGITPNGSVMNPQLAAYYAARGARDAKMAAGALDAGDAQLDRQINRAGMLQTQAMNKQSGDLAAQKSIPSRTAAVMNLLKGGSSILKDTGALKSLGGLFGQGMDWLRGNPYAGGNAAFGGGGDFDWVDAW